jgi:arabinofuranosyltransferase
VLALAAAVLLALPVPWTHWALTHDLRTREETFQMRVAIAPHWPAPVRGYARAFDRLQDWLIGRFVCARHQEHRVLHQLEIETYPSRAEGARIGPAGHPVYAGLAIGVPGWVLPNVDIIDLWGLNDYVIARAEPIPASKRQMAHDRRPPEGYVECFQPNVFLPGPGRMQVRPRDPELTDAQIVACETRWRAWTNGRR